MTPDRREQVERIVLALLDVQAGDRAGALDDLCRDDSELRREAEWLLAGQDTANALLRTPVPGAARAMLQAAARTSLVGRTLGPYRIEAPLGAGGMGQGYRAHDAKLGRDVALKVLPPDVAADPPTCRVTPRLYVDGTIEMDKPVLRPCRPEAEDLS